MKVAARKGVRDDSTPRLVNIRRALIPSRDVY